MMRGKLCDERTRTRGQELAPQTFLCSSAILWPNYKVAVSEAYRRNVKCFCECHWFAVLGELGGGLTSNPA